jgi:hypothetical protein
MKLSGNTGPTDSLARVRILFTDYSRSNSQKAEPGVVVVPHRRLSIFL